MVEWQGVRMNAIGGNKPSKLMEKQFSIENDNTIIAE